MNNYNKFLFIVLTISKTGLFFWKRLSSNLAQIQTQKSVSFCKKDVGIWQGFFATQNLRHF